MSTDNATTTPAVSANFRYRDEHGKMINKEAAIAKRWAHKEDGTPTKLYLFRLQVREAEKAGLPRPIRPKKTYESGSQTHAGIASPYDLNRRSGYRTIWQVLAENANQVVPTAELTAQVIDRLKAEAPEWYEKHYGEKAYDVQANAYVTTRAPYNSKIEAMNQRVVEKDNGFMLMTEVTEPRELKKRGRKPKAKEVTPETPATLDSTIEPDNDNSVVVEEQTVEA